MVDNFHTKFVINNLLKKCLLFKHLVFSCNSEEKMHILNAIFVRSFEIY
jgi:hypothetical protein